MAGALVNSVVEEMSWSSSRESPASMEREAEWDFRRSKTPQELHDRQYEWRVIEAVYLKRLTERNRDAKA